MNRSEPVEAGPLPVTDVSTLRLVLPFDETIRHKRAIDPAFVAQIIIVRVRIDDVVGLGYAWDISAARAQAIQLVAEDLGAGLIGEDSRHIRRLWQRSWKRLSFMGQHHGLALAALAAIDMALWDALGKRAGLPLHQMWGAVRSELPVYVTAGTLSLSPEQLGEEGRTHQAAGYKAMKVQVGSPDWKRDIRRIAKLRERVGDTFEIFVDAHMQWDRRTALLAGEGFAELGVSWYEDPLPPQDLAGYAQLRRALKVPVVHGENVYTRQGVLDILRAEAADIIMLDPMHCGGPTELLQAAALAAAHHIPVSSHAFHAVSAHMMAACDHCNFVEYQDIVKIFEGEPEVRNGIIHVSDQPGFGLELPAETISRYGAQ